MASFIHDIPSSAVLEGLVLASTMTQTQNGTVIDMVQGDTRCNVILNVGAISNGSKTYQVQQCTEAATTSGGWSNITGASLTAAATGVQALAFDRDQRYIRLATTGSATNVTCSAVILQNRKFLVG